MVQCYADRIKHILLLGSTGKRRTFFEKAADEANVKCKTIDYNNFKYIYDMYDINQACLKIDPPVTESFKIDDIKNISNRYFDILNILANMDFGAFLNHPFAIAELLDKKRCKKKLINNSIPSTIMYDEDFHFIDDLLSFMSERRISQVFLKPVTGSGAAGVAALRFSPLRNSLIVFSCADTDGKNLVNTKKLNRYEGEKAKLIIKSLLSVDCIVEKWHSKASYKNYTYDLRVVVQNGKVDYILPRLSSGPITNLHLNNHAERFENIGLDRNLIEDIKNTCIKAVSCFDGLSYAGVDILCERGKKPLIIEMNAQGDLIYQDIFSENIIYKNQINMIKKGIKKYE